GLIHQSSVFNNNFYGSGINTPNSLIIQNTDGPLQFVASTSTSPAYISFLTASSSIASERMRITPSGQVGIGTTTPQAQIDIASSTGSQLGLSDGSATSAHWN